MMTDLECEYALFQYLYHYVQQRWGSEGRCCIVHIELSDGQELSQQLYPPGQQEGELLPVSICAIVELVGKYVESIYGKKRTPTRLRLELVNGAVLSLPMPGSDEEPPDEDNAMAGICEHQPDYRCVCWKGQTESFSVQQAKIVQVLWESHERHIPDVSQQVLLDAVGSHGERLLDLFRGNHAWGRTIVPGQARGTYRLR